MTSVRSASGGGGDRTVVVGGGLAGVAAAVRLADAGQQVLLLESRPRLGGRACSFERHGLRADTGQHVFLRGYTRYRGLLDRMGVAHLAPVQDRLEISVLLPGRPPYRLRRTRRGPAPLHLLPTLAGYAALTPAERLRAIRTVAALRTVDPQAPATDTVAFGTWLRRHGEGPRALSRLWGLVTVAALNLDPDEASLALAAMVFRTGLLEAVADGDIGVPQVPLSELHDVPVRRLLSTLGVSVRTGVRVTGVGVGPSGFVLATKGSSDRLGTSVEADRLLLAVPHEQAATLVPPGAVPDPGRWAGLGASPIVNLHVHYDRRVLGLPFAAAPDSPAQWVFDRTAAAGVDEGQYLVTSVSAADAVIGQPAATVRQTQLGALRDLLPAARKARVLDAFVTREPRATFRQRPGTASLRPGAATALPGLALAGAWTDTGWPDTLEGAVRSGVTAADTLLSDGRSVAAQMQRRLTEVTTT